METRINMWQTHKGHGERILQREEIGLNIMDEGRKNIIETDHVVEYIKSSRSRVSWEKR